MRERKQGLIDGLRIAYQALQRTWNGKEDYRRWMSTEINNAKLGSISEYNVWVTAFNVLLIEKDNNIGQFIEAVDAISKLRKPARDEFLRSRLQD